MRAIHLTLLPLLLLAAPAQAEQRGNLEIQFKYTSTTAKQVEDFDGTWLHKTEIDQSAVMMCPIFNDGPSPYSYLDQLTGSGGDDPTTMPAGEFEIWFSEGCTGSLTANNRVTLSKGGTVKPIEAVSGTRPFTASVDANVTVETDLKKKSTRVWIVAPDAEGFVRQSLDARKTATLSALPEGNVIAGPAPGPIKNGEFKKAVDGGEYSVTWTFTRGK